MKKQVHMEIWTHYTWRCFDTFCASLVYIKVCPNLVVRLLCLNVSRHLTVLGHQKAQFWLQTGYKFVAHFVCFTKLDMFPFTKSHYSKWLTKYIGTDWFYLTYSVYDTCSYAAPTATTVFNSPISEQHFRTLCTFKYGTNLNEYLWKNDYIVWSPLQLAVGFPRRGDRGPIPVDGGGRSNQYHHRRPYDCLGGRQAGLLQLSEHGCSEYTEEYGGGEWPVRYGPLTRYVKLRVAHAPGMPGMPVTCFPPPTSKQSAS